MKAARFYDKFDIRIEDVPKPEPKDGEILVDVAWGGICGTDLHEYLIGPLTIPTKERPNRLTGDSLPVTLGHEFCGHVSQAPEGATSADGTPIQIGQPVMVDPRLNCRTCFSCTAGSTNLCSKWAFLGLAGAGGGGFSETVAVRPDMCYPLPKNMPLDQAVLIEPLAVGRRALVKSGLPMNEFKDLSVLVTGGGPVGFSVICNLKAAGATNVFVSEPTATRQAQCKPLVAAVIDPIKQSVAEECRRHTDGKGVDVVFDCAGITKGLEAGMEALRPKGIYVNVAGWETEFVVPLHLFMAKELELKTTLAYDDKDFGDVVRDFVAGELVRVTLNCELSLSDFRQIQGRRKDDHCSRVTGRCR
jgi:(R,R)-butanediol dehydrogenase/meso-butanediol dehydrogenase/diacetyl reductase